MRTMVVTVLAVASLLLVVGAAGARPAAKGPWDGTWNRAANEIDVGGPTKFVIHQSGNRLTVTIPWRGCTSRAGGVAVGWAQGNSAAIAARQTDGSLVIQSMQLASNHKTITGTFEVTAGTCKGTKGPFDATFVGPSR